MTNITKQRRNFQRNYSLGLIGHNAMGLVSGRNPISSLSTRVFISTFRDMKDENSYSIVSVVHNDWDKVKELVGNTPSRQLGHVL